MRYKEMVEKIDSIVTTEFLSEMELKLLPNSYPVSQEEARKLIIMLGEVYMISHSITCEACGRNYK